MGELQASDGLLGDLCGLSGFRSFIGPFYSKHLFGCSAGKREHLAARGRKDSLWLQATEAQGGDGMASRAVLCTGGR